MRCQDGIFRACSVAGVFLLAAGVAACSKKPNQMQLGQAASAGQQQQQVEQGTQRAFNDTTAGDRVHFATDSSQLSPKAQSILRSQAQWLARNPQYRVTIEGHADERGTREYNIALGARRANAVRDFLSRLGVNPGRIRTISYGKERPVAVCNDISCWSQNRRAVTVLNSRPTS